MEQPDNIETRLDFSAYIHGFAGFGASSVHDWPPVTWHSTSVMQGTSWGTFLAARRFATIRNVGKTLTVKDSYTTIDQSGKASAEIQGWESVLCILKKVQNRRYLMQELRAC